jgi:hypothetical protein
MPCLSAALAGFALAGGHEIADIAASRKLMRAGSTFQAQARQVPGR